MNAINDGIILEAQIYQILKRYFGSEPLYVPLLELFHEVTLQTALGQFRPHDRRPAQGRPRFSHVYKQIGPQPPAGPMFAPNLAPTDPSPARCPRASVQDRLLLLLPAGGTRAAGGITDPTPTCSMRDLRRDGRDVPGAGRLPRLLRRPAGDGQGAPTSVTTSVRGSSTGAPNRLDKQRNVLEANYAKKSDGAERAVRTVYDELDIVGKFRAYEDAANARVLEMIAQVHGMPTTIFTMLLAKIYKRNK